MLVLSRRPEQSVLLGDDVTIVVLGVEGDRVKLGIQAPPTVSILRGELYAQLKAANAAAPASPDMLAKIAAALRNSGLGSITRT
jgi:carbon storage regulator